MRRLALVAVIFCLLGNVFAQQHIVQLPQGNINGIIQRDRNNVQFFSFRRIPYAAAPVGQLRFRDPQPPVAWSGTRESTQDMPYCFQTTQAGAFGQEDCLFLNVHSRQYVRQENTASQLPVMVWIHGGFFTTGSGREEFLDPAFLMTQNVVLVTINYRLNIFGFLSLDDSALDVPGNAGLKDQVMALRWVQTNIHHFGGNRNMVTIFGQGSGGTSVHYHVLSQLSRGLFRNAIMQSGTALTPWTTGLRNNGMALAQHLSINTTIGTSMMEVLRWLNPEHVFTGYQRLLASSPLAFGSIVNPVIERDVATGFLIGEPFDLIQERRYNDVPLLIGYTDNEGIAFSDLVIQDFTQMVPPDLNITRANLLRSVGAEIQQFYFGDSSVHNTAARIRMFTDAWFGFPAFRTAVAHRNTSESTIFFYRFSADTALNIFKHQTSHPSLAGASHLDDVAYLFRTSFTPAIITGSLEDFAITRMVTSWANFARNSNSSDATVGFDWFPVIPSTAQREVILNYAEISTRTTTMHVDPDATSMLFWNRIYNQHFRSSSATIQRGFVVLTVGFSIFNLFA